MEPTQQNAAADYLERKQSEFDDLLHQNALQSGLIQYVSDDSLPPDTSDSVAS